MRSNYRHRHLGGWWHSEPSVGDGWFVSICPTIQRINSLPRSQQMQQPESIVHRFSVMVTHLKIARVDRSSCERCLTVLLYNSRFAQSLMMPSMPRSQTLSSMVMIWSLVTSAVCLMVLSQMNSVISHIFIDFMWCLQRKNNDLDEQMLILTAELLANIPEFSTLWNIRRELFEDWAASRLRLRLFVKHV